MCIRSIAAPRSTVALLAEGVDRNSSRQTCFIQNSQSPSSRRAWIEMCFFHGLGLPLAVALLAEGVDRNYSCRMFSGVAVRRPPRGGRG